MARRGQDSFIPRLIISVICIAAVLGVVYLIVSALTSKNRDYEAKRSLDLLADRIGKLQTGQLPAETTIIMDLPKDYDIVSFSSGEEQRKVFISYKAGPGTMLYKDEGKAPAANPSNAANGIPTVIKRPGSLFSGCGSNSCLCVYREDATAKPISCRRFDMPRINAFYGEIGPTNTRLLVERERIEVGTVGTSVEKPGNWGVDKNGNPIIVEDRAAYGMS